MTQINSIAHRTLPRNSIWIFILGSMIALLAWLASPMSIRQMAALASSTLISEDLTCIAAGQLIGRGAIGTMVGVGGCLSGIFLGDLGLWLIGRLVVRQIITWPWAVRCVEKARMSVGAAPLNGRLGAIVFAARFVPGLRLPTYVALGAAGVGAAAFSAWTLIAAIVWTPLIVLLVARIGDAAVNPLQAYLGASWLLIAAAVLMALLIIRIGTLLLTEMGRARIVALVSRIWRWEFWPSWLFYLPLIPWIAWLSLRHRGFTTITAANPGIPHGGFVGESKHQILSAMSSEHVSSTVLIRSGNLDDRLVKLDRALSSLAPRGERAGVRGEPLGIEKLVDQRKLPPSPQPSPLRGEGEKYPVILKPDAGQRGAGVKRVRTREEAVEYLRRAEEDVIVQSFHPGPYEAGVFYYRIPGESSGHILSITDKHFSELIGDDESTLEQLIWRHPRYRMQAGVFLARHGDQMHRILADGEHFRLAVAGNHCQGTMFRDGSHLITPELEQKIDQIAKTFDGFYFGRFDVRYSDVEQFKRGRDFTIIELNGVTSESTNLYDPSWSLLRAYRQLFKQWAILFQIGAANRLRGEKASSIRELVRDSFAFYSNRKTNLVAD